MTVKTRPVFCIFAQDPWYTMDGGIVPILVEVCETKDAADAIVKRLSAIEAKQPVARRTKYSVEPRPLRK